MGNAVSAWNLLKQARFRTTVLLMVLMLCGCMSVPLATMWQMRNFEASDLMQVQPEQIRLAGKIDPAPIAIVPARSHLALVLVPRAQGAADVQYEFGLRNARLSESGLVPSADPRWQVFELDDKGIAAWKRLQPELINLKANYQGATFKFEFKTEGNAPAGTDAWITSARLQLGPSQQPLTLMDRARIPIDAP